MTKTGLYLGKFAPLHAGHEYCIETALDECDHVIVLVYHTDVIDIPLQQRVQWIEDLYGHAVHPRGRPRDGATLDVIEAWTGPEGHGYTDELKTAHEEYVLQLLRQYDYGTDAVDAFYSSEQYGRHMADALGAEDRRVDPDRETKPISATMIRNDGPHEHQSMLSDRVYRDLIPRIAVVGGVSSGKTTLARALANEYETEWMPEHGREFWKEHADENGMLTKRQLYQLAWEHIHGEDEMLRDAHRYLFVDTTPLTTMAWSKYYHGDVNHNLRDLAKSTTFRYDLHVLCDPNIPFEEDPGRDGRQNRKRLHRMHKALMDEYNIDYIVVDGDVDDRVQQVKETLEQRDLGVV